MLRQRQPRTTNAAYLAWLRKQRCACGCLKGPPCDAAHLRAGSPAHDKRHIGLGEKPDDRWALPLTRTCHMAQHAHHMGELDWWARMKGIHDPFRIASEHYQRFEREQQT